MRRASGFIGISIAVAVFAFYDAAQAQGGAVKVIFEKHGLLGTFARDCSRPAASDNLYFVNRLLDADHVQRDAMEGPTYRPWYLIINQAREAGRNEVWFSGRLSGMFSGKSYDGEVAEGSWRIEPDRLLQMEATLAGQKVLAGGRWLATGREMLPLYKCGK